MNEPDVNDLIEIFDQLFEVEQNTKLIAGAKEPIYIAARGDKPATIFTREDFFSSALHEIAHWTIAGEKRRQLDDFGYWYEPEGRNNKQQQEFERVEIKPQAIEWVLSLACNHRFNFSSDNLSQEINASDRFKKAVKEQANAYLTNGLPDRAEKLYLSLIDFYREGQKVSHNEI